MFKPKIDMQMHSIYSDGDFSPAELMQKAKKIGLAGAVLTDHTVINGVDESILTAKRLGLLTCEGIEINGKYKDTGVHILGYSKKFNRKVLWQGLKTTIKGDVDYNQAIANKLRELKIVNIDFEKLLRQKKGVIMKIDILRAMMEKTNLTYDQALQMTKKGGIASVPYNEKLISVLDAVKLIQQANGVAVLAHPAEFFMRCPESRKQAKIQLRQMIDELIGHGLFGLECFSCHHTQEEMVAYSRLADRKKLFKTGGSDFHGTKSPQLKLGAVGISLAEFNKFLKLLP